MDTEPVGPTYRDRLEAAIRARHAALAACFKAPLTPLTMLMGPMSDGPEWPSDAAWLALRVAGKACIVSDGLSDPWVEPDRPGNGLGIEVFMQTPDLEPAQPDSASSIADSWLFPAVAEISHTLAQYPRLCQSLVDGNALALRFNIEHIKDGRGLVGALLHAPRGYPDELSVNGLSVRLIAATLLTKEELDSLSGKGLEGRQLLLQKLIDRGIADLSLLRRAAVI